jgi:MYXO-CTERM domain-containing protein
MRILRRVIGVLMVLLGAIWLLQGINVLKGSPMTGQTRWVVIGAVMALAGLVLLLRVSRRKPMP